MASPEVEIARQQWRAGSRRLEGLRSEPGLYRRLADQVDAIGAELRRRVGQTFTLAELADAYRGAEAWTQATVEAADPSPGWEREVALVTDAAFDLYARGASDYAP